MSSCSINLASSIPWHGVYAPPTLYLQTPQNVMVSSLLTFVCVVTSACLAYVPLTNWRILTLKGPLMCCFLYGARLNNTWAVRLPLKCSLQSLDTSIRASITLHNYYINVYQS